MRYALVDADRRALVLKPIEGCVQTATVVDHCSKLLMQPYRRLIGSEILRAGLKKKLSDFSEL